MFRTSRLALALVRYISFEILIDRANPENKDLGTSAVGASAVDRLPSCCAFLFVFLFLNARGSVCCAGRPTNRHQVPPSLSAPPLVLNTRFLIGLIAHPDTEAFQKKGQPA